MPTGAEMAVEVRAAQPEPGILRLIQNGEIVREELLPAGHQIRTYSMPANRSSWLRATIPNATTSPIYVTVDGAPVRPSADAACYFVRYLDYLSSAVSAGTVNIGPDVAPALQAYSDARSVFMTHFYEAGGTACP
jgi:hypothetical protein